MARRLAIPHTTVAKWLERGYIPASHQQRVLDAARADGIGLTPADFFTMSEASPVPPAGVSHDGADGVRDSEHDRYGMGCDAPVPALAPGAAPSAAE